MEKANDRLNEGLKCIPWYYPPVDPDLRLCSPYEAKDFTNKLEKISHDECKVCDENVVINIENLLA